jgi:hypothetical protein
MSATEVKAAVQRRDGELARLTAALAAADQRAREQDAALAAAVVTAAAAAASGSSAQESTRDSPGERIATEEHALASAAALAVENAALRAQLAALQPRAAEAAVLTDRLHDARALVEALEERLAEQSHALAAMEHVVADARATAADHSDCERKLREAETRAAPAAAAAEATVTPVPVAEVPPAAEPSQGPVVSRSRTAPLAAVPTRPEFSYRLDDARLDELRRRNVRGWWWFCLKLTFLFCRRTSRSICRARTSWSFSPSPTRRWCVPGPRTRPLRPRCRLASTPRPRL